MNAERASMRVMDYPVKPGNDKVGVFQADHELLL